MESLYDRFHGLNTQAQIRFLKEGELIKLADEEQIKFIKDVVKTELSSKTLATALKRLRELHHKDRFFFRQFLYHVDSSVANAAKRAISDSQDAQDAVALNLIETMEKCAPEERIKLIHSFFTNEPKIQESQFISLLDFKDKDSTVRNELIKILIHFDLDEESLARAIISGKTWTTRNALVEILGKRKSPYLLSIINELLQDTNVEVKLTLIQALESYDREAVRSHLICLSQDSLIWVRKAALKVLG